ncbi:MAG: hypothetical protein IJM50_04005 [Lachnospiraceae bacterium]|nr:hypothetical protein [Lachnospiraceae bacterium]
MERGIIPAAYILAVLSVFKGVRFDREEDARRTDGIVFLIGGLVLLIAEICAFIVPMGAVMGKPAFPVWVSCASASTAVLLFLGIRLMGKRKEDAQR